jgi:hypothetical protein
MSVAITNYRKRLMTLLLVGDDGVRPVRIPSGYTVEGLPDSVLDLPVVRAARAAGELGVRVDAVRVRGRGRGGIR